MNSESAPLPVLAPRCASARALSVAAQPIETIERFACFGATCNVVVRGGGPAGTEREAAARARLRLLGWHAQFSRFEPNSELSKLNRDPRERVPVTAIMARFVETALQLARLTGGLVDPTLLDELESAGYASDLRLPPSSRGPWRVAPSRRRWQQVSVDRERLIVSRPPGVRLDPGGIVKGMSGDVLAVLLSAHDSFAIEAAGDIVLGGSSSVVRPVQITSPRPGAEILHTFEMARGAVATSGVTKRRWTRADGTPAHHLIDPRTGLPAATGVIQATALAPTGAEAEARAKAALLSGSERGPDWLPYGGLLVLEGGSHKLIENAEIR